MRGMTYLFLFLLVAVPCTADIIYVKASGTGSGASWADAYGDFQDGLDDAEDPCDIIWVAEGTYYPTSDYGLGIGDRGKHFQMKNGVGIYGGFPDTGDPDMSDRNPNMYETILNGNIGSPGDNSDNCYHVFYHPGSLELETNAILDGFTITGGNANGSNPHSYGAGMYNWRSSPKVMNCTFSYNRATGAFAGIGGGMFNYNYSSPTVTDCTFIDNEAESHGGGMYNSYYSSPKVTDCTFNRNWADNFGGGVYNSDFSNSTVISCTFTKNRAIEYGGGIVNYNSNPTIINCTFNGNLSYGSFTFGYGGGGIFNWGSSPTVIGCTFSGNISENYGGGMNNYQSSHPTVTNCTFSNNSAEYGGGMCNYQSGNPTVTNCIIWGNTASSEGNEVYKYMDSTPVISYCDISGCGGSGAGWDTSLGTDAGGNIDVDPNFVDSDGLDGVIGTYDDNLRLLAVSPCIDNGDNSAVTEATDMDGRERVIDGDSNGEAIVDMGSYEFLPPAPFIGIWPKSIQFTGYFEQGNPEPQVLSIRNSGIDTLNWEVSWDSTWLQIDPNTGSSTGEPNDVTLSVDITGLELGIYDCNIVVSDPCATNSPLIVPVTLEVVGPVIELSASQFDFVGAFGGPNPDDRILTITNSGSGTLYWQISYDDCDWLTVDPCSGSSTGEPNDVILSVDTTGLPEDTYECDLTISDPNADNNPQTVQVILSFECMPFDATTADPVGTAIGDSPEQQIPPLTTYNMWVAAGRPECWCYVAQCRGNADGITNGSLKGGYWRVGSSDLGILATGYHVKEPPEGVGAANVFYNHPQIGPIPGICANFNRMLNGSPKAGYWHVGADDLNRLAATFLDKDPTVPLNDCGGSIDNTPP